MSVVLMLISLSLSLVYLVVLFSVQNSCSYNSSSCFISGPKINVRGISSRLCNRMWSRCYWPYVNVDHMFLCILFIFSNNKVIPTRSQNKFSKSYALKRCSVELL